MLRNAIASTVLRSLRASEAYSSCGLPGMAARAYSAASVQEPTITATLFPGDGARCWGRPRTRHSPPGVDYAAAAAAWPPPGRRLAAGGPPSRRWPCAHLLQALAPRSPTR